MARLKDKIRYLVIIPNADGSFRAYWRPSTYLRQQHGWKQECLGTSLGQNDLHDAKSRAMELNDQMDAWRRGDQPTNTGVARAARQQLMMDHLIDTWLRSAEFSALAPSTKRFYSAHAPIVQAWGKDIPVREITASMVHGLYREFAAHHPRKAQALVQTGQAAFTWGTLNASQIGKGMPQSVNLSPFARQKMHHKPKKGAIWSPAAITAIVEASDTYQNKDGVTYHSIGTAVMINEWVAQNTCDIIALQRAWYVEGSIDFARSKTQIGVKVQLPAAVQARLEQERTRQLARNLSPMSLLVCDGSGMAWRYRHFCRVFAKIRDFAAKTNPGISSEITGLHFRELRHTGATRMDEAGVPRAQIAAVMCVSVDTANNIIDRYSSRTNKMADAAIEKRIAFELAAKNK